MTNPYQAHSTTSREAAEALTSVDSMEGVILAYLNEGEYTGDDLTNILNSMHSDEFNDVQTGTVAARLRGLELKEKVIKLRHTRLTSKGRKAHLWIALDRFARSSTFNLSDIVTPNDNKDGPEWKLARMLVDIVKNNKDKQGYASITFGPLDVLTILNLAKGAELS